MEVDIKLKFDLTKKIHGKIMRLTEEEAEKIGNELAEIIRLANGESKTVIQAIFSRWKNNKAVYAYGLWCYYRGYMQGREDGQNEILQELAEAMKGKQGGN